MKRKDILAILIPSFIFAAAWIILSIHHNIVSSTISETLNIQIAPISATFDVDAIASLKKRQNITPSYETSIPVQNVIASASATASANITPTPVIENLPIGSGSANVATSEGTLLK
jgi:hypothetical protein